jgi:membrane-bound lytic murein transglycosylase B
MHMKTLAAVLSATFLATGIGHAATCGNTAQGFPGFLAAMKKQAIKEGVNGEALAQLDSVQYDPSIIKRDRAQNVFAQSFLQFAGRMATEGNL